MSNIVKNEEDIDRLRWLVDNLKGMDFSEETVNFTFDELTESMDIKPKLLLDSGYFLYLDRKTGNICYNPCLMDRSLDMLISGLRSKTKDYLLLRSVILMYVLGHELEHYNQYLVSEGIKSENSKNINRAYKLIYGMPKDKTIFQRMYKNKHLDAIERYNRGKQDYFVERNAQIEVYEMITQVLKEKYPELSDEFNELRNLYLVLGYERGRNGNVYETMDGIGMLDEYYKHYQREDLSFEDKIRYGLPVSDFERESVLCLVKKK